MRYIKALLIAALALAAFSSIAASANAALPSFLQLAGITNSTLTAESATGKSTFTGIVNLTGEGYKFVLTINAEMTSLGPGTLWFLKAKFGGKNCKTAGDTAGNVLVSGEWHTVLAASGGGANLFLLLILVPTTTIECEGTNIIVSGSQLINVEPFGKEVTEFTAATGKCTGNTPAFVNYLNDSGVSTAANLKSESGGLKSNTCEEVEPTITLKASGMGLEVMEP